MITGAIAFVFFISTIVAVKHGEWLSAVIGAIIVLFVICLGIAGREHSEAYSNFVEYWSKGGPDRKE